ncbi:hypothetical protein FRC14_004161 [Serendipita sp. 396]|nr:hypothetical protein FRC14_004161 [Serendipita sp. 396]
MLSLARNSGSSTICLHSLRRFHISVTRYEKATPKAKNSGAKKLKKADKPEPDEMNILLAFPFIEAE